MSKDHKMIEVQASCVPDSMELGWAIFLISGTHKWHKDYRCATDARNHALELGLPLSIRHQLEGKDRSSNNPAPTCSVDIDKLVKLGYRKG